ncbi:helix-turn-helix domain-containing protein, partial [Flavobacterium succinicans]
NDKNYTITLYTLNKICEARNLKLSDFFKLIDK